ncbi:hypothetical protein MG293_018594 [Ovis ammon polii]|uniref:Uncharacterized protein n=1 Tax=Ovis ammon polii TaxID=230172 RepID=A0AAD4TP92_OVIAM|nr:hypothetical protein MG293_018594 [Ovis ammon polii]
MPGGPRWLSNQASSGCFSADNRSLSMEKRSPTINASGNKVRLKKVDGCKVSFQVGRHLRKPVPLCVLGRWPTDRSFQKTHCSPLYAPAPQCIGLKFTVGHHWLPLCVEVLFSLTFMWPKPFRLAYHGTVLCSVCWQLLRAGNVASLPGELGAQAASQGSVRFVPAGFEEQPDRLSASPVLLPWCGDSGLIPSECAQLLPSPPRTQQMLWWKSQEDGTGLHPPLTQTSEVSEPQACTRPAVLPVLHGSLAQSLLRCQLDRRCPRVRPSRWRPVPASRRCLVNGGMPDTRACSSCSDPAKDLDSDARTEPVEEVQEEGLEIRCHGLALPVSILAVPRAVSCSMKTFQALPDAHSSPKRPPKWTLQGQERQECGVCSEAPGSLGPRVRSRMDPVGARILTLSRLPGSPAISRAVGCLPKRRSSRKTRTHLLLWAVLGSPGPEGQEGASGRVSSSGSKA